jgi:hypothetical protein
MIVFLVGSTALVNAAGIYRSHFYVVMFDLMLHVHTVQKC